MSSCHARDRERALLARLQDAADVQSRELWSACARVRMYRLASRMRREGVTACAIYGAGEVGMALFDAAHDLGLHVVAFVESDQLRTGQRVQGVPVVHLPAALDHGVSAIALGTMSSQETMRRAILSALPGRRHSVYADDDAPPPRATQLVTLCDTIRDSVTKGRRVADVEWVMANAEERMDAFLPVFRESRRTFHLMRYRFAAPYAEGARVLDCASGTGYGAHVLAVEGLAHSVLGVDVSGDAVEYARRYYASRPVSFVALDAGRLHELARRFDLITSFETIEHVPDDAAMLEAVVRALAPGGRLIISTPNDWPFEHHPFHVRRYDATSFRARLARWFDRVELYGQWSADLGVRPALEPLEVRSTVPAECLVAVCSQHRAP